MSTKQTPKEFLQDFPPRKDVRRRLPIGAVVQVRVVVDQSSDDFCKTISKLAKIMALGQEIGTAKIIETRPVLWEDEGDL